MHDSFLTMKGDPEDFRTALHYLSKAIIFTL
jgi:hypothetical protein